MITISDVEEEIRNFILEKNPDLTMGAQLTYSQLLSYRLSYVRTLLADETLKNEQLNQLVYKELKGNEDIINRSAKTSVEELTLGQKAADAIAKFGGSWPFIFIFIVVIILWIILNTAGFFIQPFDKYPFILLNLALSCLAAIQAPIIMMSQNREEERDREQAKSDYKVNLKAEVEINLLHEKIDYLINDQWQHLVEIQNIQLELLGELQEQLERVKNKKR
ncbi:DUF1003 domain-containing protein [Enterococcus sp. BWB1-3]|nr:MULTISPECIES: DUF1003 domain-containing protein [unclassified Enterococcus]MBL1227646.1 DUF1003 domain-containing protein [Enterococcus sp. BWB1-3]MCB5954424.1 DUF1003 domain-containing protein [Enterococcus sp. CWB-B31]